MALPSSLTLPIRIGIFFAVSAIASLNDLIVMIRPSTVGPEPTRGALAGPPGPRPAGNGPLIFVVAEVAAAFSLAHSIFWSEAISAGPSPALAPVLSSPAGQTRGKHQRLEDCRRHPTGSTHGG